MSRGVVVSRGSAELGLTYKSYAGAAAVGLASAMMGQPAAAQKVAEPAELPPVEVTAAKKKAKAKAVAQKKAPAPKATAVAAPPPVMDAEPPVAASAFGDGSGTTPSSGNTLQSGTGIGRLPGTLQDMPQTVNTISQEQIKQQKINQLDQALRNVPGVTVNAGEGGGGMNGDQFRIRGFQSKGDIYVDGLRDFGVYVRDAFAYEQIDVIKGPSSESFGMGTVGGAINIQQKRAHLGDSNYIEGAIGTDSFYRTMIDVNKQLTNTIAARAVALYHDQEFADRDQLFSERFGFLGSVAFGLGTDTEWVVNYMHQNGERLPDMGVPISDPDATAFHLGAAGSQRGRPVTEFGANRSNFYGKDADKDEYQVDMLTSRLTHKLNKHLTLYNDTRLGLYERDFIQTVTSCNGACATGVAAGNYNVVYGFGGPAGFGQDAWGIQNVTTAVAKFNTGWLKHEAVAGIDLFYQEDDRDPYSNLTAAGGAATKIAGTIANPNFSSDNYFVRRTTAEKSAEAENYAAFFSDRVWLTDQFSVLGGVRYDNYSATYNSTAYAPATGITTVNPTVDTDTDFYSPKASIIWEPAKNQTYYASWAKSYSPVGQFITNDNDSIAGAGQQNRDPEENELWEVGGKLSTYDGRLGFTGALFRVDKGNATYSNTDGDTILSGEKQRVQGIELGASGSITNAWTLQAAYAYLDSEVLESTAVYPDDFQTVALRGKPYPALRDYIEGNRVPFASEHNVSLWTTYDISKHLSIAGTWLVGGGIVYSSDYFTNSSEFAIVPGNFTFDAMTSYEVDGWRFAVNGYNLSDELNYEAAIGNRAVVAPGRSAVFTVGKKF